MLLNRWRSFHDRAEQGQALALFALGLVGFLGFVAMSIDVGRAYWARTQIQSAVDAAALAGAQSMPFGTSTAATYVDQYWISNSGFIRSQGQNVSMTVTYPPGNRAIQVDAQADIPTWFARVVGLDHWTVSASGTAAASVLDIGLVLDISGSMCWGSYPPVDAGSPVGPFGPHMAPGRTADTIALTSGIPAGGGDNIVINVSSTALLTSTSSATNQAKFGYNTSTRYWQFTPSNGRAGVLLIDQEVFIITGAPTATTIPVRRAQANGFRGLSSTTKVAHTAGTALFTQHTTCALSAPSATAGPWASYDGMIADAKYFTTLFNGTYDTIGLTTFSSGAAIRRGLTGNFAQVRSDMDAIVNPDGGTNSALGIAAGRQVLDGAGSRPNAIRVLVFLTDGRANSYCGSPYSAGNYSSLACPSAGGGNDGNATAVAAANAEAARAAADRGIKIYTIGFGAFVDDAFLTNIANVGGGRYYKAPTLAELDDAFRAIAAETHIALTR